MGLKPENMLRLFRRKKNRVRREEAQGHNLGIANLKGEWGHEYKEKDWERIVSKLGGEPGECESRNKLTKERVSIRKEWWANPNRREKCVSGRLLLYVAIRKRPNGDWVREDSYEKDTESRLNVLKVRVRSEGRTAAGTRVKFFIY